MNTADRILLSLDAHECLWGGLRAPASRARAPSASVEAETPAIFHAAHDDFGGLLDYKSIGDLKDLVTQTQARRQEMDRWYAQASPAWVNKNSAAFTAFTNDRLAFNARFDAAMSKAQLALLGGKINFYTPDTLIPATDEYTGLAKAMRQCYQPIAAGSACPVAKGDWFDLFNRAAAVSPSLGIPAPTDKAYQPTAADLSGALFAATASSDVVAQVTGGQSTATGPLPQDVAEAVKKHGKEMLDSTGDTLSLVAWLLAHQRVLIIGAVAVVGGIGLLSIMPLLMLPAKVAKGAALLAA